MCHVGTCASMRNAADMHAVLSTRPMQLGDITLPILQILQAMQWRSNVHYWYMHIRRFTAKTQ